MEHIGRYKILRELGRGSMGIVYLANDPLIGRQVAIKTIRLSNLESGNNWEELRKRLFREAQSVGILSHPGIITVYDVGEQGDDAYIVMELVDGRSLESILDGSGPHHSAALFSVLKHAAAALDCAHGKGIIHRDVKPANIMICADGSAKIADFGVAKLSASHSMTQTGFVLGTPSYMSPEQAQGRAIDGRSDQFSLAVVAYRMLTGKLPFEGPTLTALLTKILWEEPDYEQAGLYPPVLHVFKKALAKEPNLRFASCGEFVKELEAAHAGQSAPARGRLAGPAKPLVPSDEDRSVRADVETPAREEEPPQEVEPGPAPVKAKAEAAQAVEDPQPQHPSVAPQMEVPVTAPAGKSARWVWAGAAAVVVLAARGFWALRDTGQPESAVKAPEAAAVSVPSSPEPVQPVQESVQRQEPVRPVPMPEKISKPAASPAKDSPMSHVPEPKPAALPLTGTIEWSGNLPKKCRTGYRRNQSVDWKDDERVSRQTRQAGDRA